MSTLFDALLQTARALESLHEGLATGGSTTTVVDSVLTNIGWADDDFNSGTVFVSKTTDGLAPQSESRIVTDYTNSSGTITVGTAFSAAVGAGDYYGVATRRYPRGMMLSKINEVLRELSVIPTITEYGNSDSGGTAVSYAVTTPVNEVWCSTSTATPFHWRKVQTFRVAAGNLYLYNALDASRKIRLVVNKIPTMLIADADVVSPFVRVGALAIHAALKCARMRLQEGAVDDQRLIQMVNDLMTRAKEAPLLRTAAEAMEAEYAI